MASLPRLYTVKDVTQATGLSKSTVHDLVARGELPAFRPPKTRIVRIPEAAFLDFLAKFTTV